MNRTFLAGAVVLTASLLAASGAAAATPTLNGTVGPGYTITLAKGGKKVTSLKAGKYTFVITDKATNHSFGLDGPNGFAKDFTSVSYKGTKTVTVTLKKGSFKFYCQPHERTMFGNFTVK